MKQSQRLLTECVWCHEGARPSWRRRVSCMWELLTCSRWPRTGAVGISAVIRPLNTAKPVRFGILVWQTGIFGSVKKTPMDTYNRLAHVYGWVNFALQMCLLLMFFPAAGNAFSQAAQLHLQMQSKHDAATNFIDAGNAFKKADPHGQWKCSPYNCLGLQLSLSWTFPHDLLNPYCSQPASCYLAGMVDSTTAVQWMNEWMNEWMNVRR